MHSGSCCCVTKCVRCLLAIGIDTSPLHWAMAAHTWEYIVGTGGGSQQAESVRPYQERGLFVGGSVTGPGVTTTFYGDEDEDGRYDNPSSHCDHNAVG